MKRGACLLDTMINKFYCDSVNHRREGINTSQGPGYHFSITHPLSDKEIVAIGWTKMMGSGLTVLVGMGREAGETGRIPMVTLDTEFSL